MFKILFFIFLVFSPFGAKLQLYTHKIKDINEWRQLADLPLSSKFNAVESVKIFYELKNNKFYFINGKKFKYHYQFAFQQLDYEDAANFNYNEYSNTKDRKYILANVNFYKSSKIYTVDFFNDDDLPIDKLSKFYTNLKSTVYFGKELKFLPNNILENKDLPEEIKKDIITTSELFEKQDYQVLQQGTAYGILKLVDHVVPGAYSANDIIIIKELPLSLPACKGIITQVFQTPLCHVNILAKKRNIPNISYKNALLDTSITNNIGKYIMLKCDESSIIIKPISKEEFNENNAKAKAIIKVPNLDLTEKRLIDLKEADISFINKIGGKAAHFSELYKIKVGKEKLPVPQNAFAIPFFYYQQFVMENNLQSKINYVLKLKEEKEIIAALADLRNSFINGRVNSELIKLVQQKLIYINKNYTYRFRSSTNAEDILGFTGAGLYDSKSGSLIDTNKPIEKAIKKVWASLWTDRAYIERSIENIDQSNLAMAILVHRAFGTELVNGVAVTKDLYRDEYPAYTINLQKDEISIVQPNDSLTCEQIRLHIVDVKKDNTSKYSKEVITYSSLHPNRSLLTDKEFNYLGKCLNAVHFHFLKLYSKKNAKLKNNKSFFDPTDFAVDVEFKKDARDSKIYLKQARPY